MSVTFEDTRVLANIMELFAKYVEKGNIDFREDGVHINSMDKSHTSLLHCCLSEVPVHNISIGVSFDILHKILSVYPYAMYTTLRPNIDDGNLDILIMTEKGEQRFTMNCIKVDECEMEIPDMEYLVDVVLNTGDVMNAIDQVDSLGIKEVTIIQTELGDIRIRYSSRHLKGDVIIGYGVDERGRGEMLCIQIAYLKMFLESGPLSRKIRLSYTGNSTPLRVRCPFVSKASRRDFVEIHISPIIENVREY